MYRFPTAVSHDFSRNLSLTDGHHHIWKVMPHTSCSPKGEDQVYGVIPSTEFLWDQAETSFQLTTICSPLSPFESILPKNLSKHPHPRLDGPLGSPSEDNHRYSMFLVLTSLALVTAVVHTWPCHLCFLPYLTHPL